MNTKCLDNSAEIVAKSFRGARPACGLILGSGWKSVTASFHIKGRLAYSRLPALGRTNVAGHAGALLWAEQAGLETFIFQGRHHWYEGLGWDPVAFPIYLLRKLGAKAVILTNSAGGIRAGLRRGALMVIKDHINAMGVSPLHGKHAGFWGPQFADQSRVYDLELQSLLKTAARKQHIAVKDGIYLGVSGPAYETPAETRAYGKWGADAVGMSTVPEATLANAAGLKVLGLSLIANTAAGLAKNRLNHESILETGRKENENISALLRGLWRAMAEKEILS